jgi:hypothetical protein
VSRPAEASFGRSVGRVWRSEVVRDTGGSIGDGGMVSVDMGVGSNSFYCIPRAGWPMGKNRSYGAAARL